MITKVFLFFERNNFIFFVNTKLKNEGNDKMPSYKTHMAVALPTSVYLATLLNVPPEITWVCAFSAVAGSLIPDIDTPRSYLGHRTKPLSTFINKKFGHRGLFHSVLFYTVLFLFLTSLSKNLMIKVGFQFCYIGIVSHILLDRISTKLKYKYNAFKRKTRLKN